MEASGEVSDQGVQVTMLKSGDSRVELMGSTSPEGPLGRFLERRGPGLHHLAIEVDDLVGELRRLREQGAPLVDEAPRPGFAGRLVAFVHPEWSQGVLIELLQSSGDTVTVTGE